MRSWCSGVSSDVDWIDFLALGLDFLDAGLGLDAVPQDDHVEDESEGGELVFLSFAVFLADFGFVAVAGEQPRSGCCAMAGKPIRSTTRCADVGLLS